MDKIQRLIKELQLHIDKPELNEVIEEKMMDVWRAGRDDLSKNYRIEQENYERKLKAWLTKEEKDRMDDSHHWIVNNNDEDICMRCDIDLFWYDKCPQYCEPRSSNKEPNEK